MPLTTSPGARHHCSPGLTARGPRSQQLLRQGGNAHQFQSPVGGGSPMRFHVAQQHGIRQTPKARFAWSSRRRAGRWTGSIAILDQRVRPSPGRHHPAQLCARSAALSPLVGERSPYRRRSPKEASPNRRCWTTFASRPASTRGLPAATHQPPRSHRRSCPATRVSRRSPASSLRGFQQLLLARSSAWAWHDHARR